MMKLAFTICSNNYLAQAKVLGDTLLKHNTDYKFAIILCDKFSDKIDYSIFKNFEIIEIDSIGVKGFNELVNNYNIIELNTYIKPFVIRFLFNKYQSDFLFYLDPDICIYDSLEKIERYFDNDEILVTPHILKPIPFDDKIPSENLFLNFGIYNLGFIGLKKTKQVYDLLSWWEDKTYNACYDKVHLGLFVDQLWINHVPIFFKKVKVIKDYGVNYGPWNFHERQLISERIFENQDELIFIHFSNFNFEDIFTFTKGYNRFEIKSNNHLVALYNEYMEKVSFINFPLFSSVKSHYSILKEKYLENLLQEYEQKNKTKIRNKKIKEFIKQFIPPILLNFK